MPAHTLKLRNIRIGPKLLGGFFTVAAMCLIVGAVGISSIRQVDRSYARLVDASGSTSQILLALSSNSAQLQIEIQQLLLESDAERREELRGKIDRLCAGTREAEAELGSYLSTEDAREQLAQLQKVTREYCEVNLRQIADLAKAHQDAQAISLLNSEAVQNNASAIRDLVGVLVDLKLTEGIELAANNNTQTGNAVAAMAGVVALALLLASGIGLLLTRSITRPLRTMTDIAARIAQGDIQQVISHDSADETGMLADSFRETVRYIQDLARGAESLANGDLSVCLMPRSEGDLLTHNFVRVADTLRGIYLETDRLAQAAVDGDLALRADGTRFSGAYLEIVEGINRARDALIGPLNVASEYIDRIAKGDLPPEITAEYRGGFGVLKDNLNACLGAVNALISDAKMLSLAAQEGRLATRVDPARHKGDFAQIIDGVNKTLDAVIGPLNTAAEYLARIAQGDIPEKITRSYQGDFNEIRNSLNTCIDAINFLITDVNGLADSAIQGKLGSRADEGRHRGDFARIVSGMNHTLDAVMGPLNVAAEYVHRIAHGDIPPRITDEYRGDFNDIKNNINTCIEAVCALVADADGLATAAAEGNLSTRADASRHGGDFARIVEGVNRTLDSLTGPMREIGQVLVKLSTHDFTAHISTEYRGDYEELRRAANIAVAGVRSAMESISGNTLTLAAAAKELTQTSQDMSSAADTTSVQANVLSKASRQVTNNVGTVATSAGQLGLGVREIARHAAEAAQVASGAVRLAESTNAKISKLGQSSSEIGDVIKFITSIAQQTSLLALNATIEASRAGQAGQGFRVVANEVKQLAKETAKAAETISKRLQAIQSDTAGAVDAIAQIGRVVRQINDIQGTIATAVEEQSATTSSIAQNAQQAAKATQEISENILGVAAAAAATASGAGHTLDSAGSLSKMASELQTIVGRFRV